MDKYKKMKQHGSCCKEWGLLLVTLAMPVFCPRLLFLLLSVFTTPLGGSVLSLVVLALVGRKTQVRSWEIDRPFNDGDDTTPDLYLFNSGDGSGWNLRAFMPDINSPSFLFTPISWVIKQAKRKVAIVLDDGSVSFPWFPVAWMSERSGGGSRIPVPPDYILPDSVIKAMQKRRNEIQRNNSGVLLTRYELDFISFTSQIFKENSLFNLDSGKPTESIDRMEILEDRVAKNESGQKEYIRDMIRDLGVILNEFKGLMVIATSGERQNRLSRTELANIKETVAYLANEKKCNFEEKEAANCIGSSRYQDRKKKR